MNILGKIGGSFRKSADGVAGAGSAQDQPAAVPKECPPSPSTPSLAPSAPVPASLVDTLASGLKERERARKASQQRLAELKPLVLVRCRRFPAAPNAPAVESFRVVECMLPAQLQPADGGGVLQTFPEARVRFPMRLIV